MMTKSPFSIRLRRGLSMGHGGSFPGSDNDVKGRGLGPMIFHEEFHLEGISLSVVLP